LRRAQIRGPWLAEDLLATTSDNMKRESKTNVPTAALVVTSWARAGQVLQSESALGFSSVRLNRTSVHDWTVTIHRRALFDNFRFLNQLCGSMARRPPGLPGWVAFNCDRTRRTGAERSVAALAPAVAGIARAFSSSSAPRNSSGGQLPQQQSSFADHAAAPNLSADQLALAATALASGLAVEEISDPGSVPDELFGDLLATLIAPTTTAAQ